MDEDITDDVDRGDAKSRPRRFDGLSGGVSGGVSVPVRCRANFCAYVCERVTISSSLTVTAQSRPRHKKICLFSSVVFGAKTKEMGVSKVSDAGVPPQRVAMAAVAGATARRTTVLHNFV